MSCKLTKKSLLSVILSLILAVGGVLACFDNAFADTDTDEIRLSDNNEYIVSYLEPGCEHGVIFWDFDGWGEIEVTNVKSSNKKIATASSAGSYIMLDIKNRAGKTNISFLVNGVEMNHDFTFYYKNPMSKCTVAGKNVCSKYNNKNALTFKKLNKKKVYIKAKSGWVITKYVKWYKERPTTTKYKTPKSVLSTTVKTKYPYDGIHVFLYNKKLGIEEVINIDQAYGNGYSPV